MTIKSIKKVRKKINNKVQPLDKKLGEVEQDTLGKIKDCENLLKTRVNEKFVWDALSSLEIKIKKELEALNGFKSKSLNARFEELEKQIKKTEEEGLKVSESKKIIEDLEKQ